MRKLSRSDRFAGLILGTAVGDALGLPYEGFSRRRMAKRTRRWRHNAVLGHGFVSDDTDHTLLVARALLRAPIDRARFTRAIAWGLRWWLLSLPVGAGRATYLAILRLWIGLTPDKSGIDSAGNGPAMRCAVIGAFFGEDAERREAYLKVQTCITHTDPRALVGARAIAACAALAVRSDDSGPPSIDDLEALLRAVGPEDQEWAALCDAMARAAVARHSIAEFAEAIGLADGVSGYMYHTVPIAIYAWYAHYGDFEASVDACLRCGGDTDTVAAIAGAIAGATVGETGIPTDWGRGLIAWPTGRRYMHAVAEQLAAAAESGAPTGPPNFFWPALLVRNLFGNIIALLHLLRHLLPPW